MSHKSELPVEVVNKIEQEAHNATSALYSPNNYDEFTFFRSGWEKGATAYAPWKVKYDELCERFKEQDQAMFALQQELSQLKAQPGPQWVKAVDRNPPVNTRLHLKVKGVNHVGFWDAPANCYVTFLDNAYPVTEVEWLDEQPAAGREEDAVAFAEWCANNYSWEYDPTSDEYQWLEANNFYTTAELYELFKQQKEK